MLIAQINQEVAVKQISSMAIVVVCGNQVIQKFEGVANNALAGEAISWAKEEAKVRLMSEMIAREYHHRVTGYSNLGRPIRALGRVVFGDERYIQAYEQITNGR